MKKTRYRKGLVNAIAAKTPNIPRMKKSKSLLVIFKLQRFYIRKSYKSFLN